MTKGSVFEVHFQKKRDEMTIVLVKSKTRHRNWRVSLIEIHIKPNFTVIF